MFSLVEDKQSLHFLWYMASSATSRLFFQMAECALARDACQCLVEHPACSYSTLHLYLHSLCEHRLCLSLNLALLVCLIAVIPTHVSAWASPELYVESQSPLLIKSVIYSGTTFKEPGCQKAYSRTLPLVEAVETLSAMLR